MEWCACCASPGPYYGPAIVSGELVLWRFCAGCVVLSVPDRAAQDFRALARRLRLAGDDPAAYAAALELAAGRGSGGVPADENLSSGPSAATIVEDARHEWEHVLNLGEDPDPFEALDIYCHGLPDAEILGPQFPRGPKQNLANRLLGRV